MPVVTLLGYDPLWYGIVMIIAVEMGLFTRLWYIGVYCTFFSRRYERTYQFRRNIPGIRPLLNHDVFPDAVGSIHSVACHLAARRYDLTFMGNIYSNLG